MIKTHKWTCAKCDDKLYLVVNDELEKDRIRLQKFETYATKHVLNKGHEMIHREKPQTGAKYV